MRATLLMLLCCLLHSGGSVPLEATIIAVDNSMHMINGDHRPNRFQCQQECVNLICNVKTQNPENTIGLMTMACLPNEYPCVHIAPAMNQDGDLIQHLLEKLGNDLSYEMRFEESMKIAWASLKHRMNKNQRPRIVAFVAGPLEIQDQQDLIKFGKKLRKNNVAIDIISFGDSPRHNTPVLTAFLNAVNRDGNSHLLSMPPEQCPPGGLSDVLFTSPILTEASAPQAPNQQGASPAAPDFAEYGGINPQLDPELAMALKMSAEEETTRRETQARREREALARSAAAASKEAEAAKQVEAPSTPAAVTAATNSTAAAEPHANADEKMEENSEEEQLRRAIELSMMDQDVDMERENEKDS
ncbi:26S proteasome regulatory complex, subunit RPN10 [Guillardia theta CCMP2712]|uniref:26S proteasome regulatory complex, subunit RPN10 n=2 Tax=Guillardia theta TaxID=55529 RepID=L1JCF6_GUITC|nr:26S proteasome regulatory complex, subunit RPN10 [Guillardia theta CCMP2712]EKX45774.1 26S proteasome regulatory complex, subunit RPN10 [Guillardia theta CCMP2712]|eukprot:XP_005832754.1 26S proteasome regulatory complex, subunit RPN10 [Guillardia theta CCMP2712]